MALVNCPGLQCGRESQTRSFHAERSGGNKFLPTVPCYVATCCPTLFSLWAARPQSGTTVCLSHAVFGCTVLTLDVLHREFLAFYDPQFRNEAREARESLFRKECTMAQYPTVKQYEQEFKLLVRTAKDLSVTDQISWFIEGLSSSLKSKCVVDHQGKDWQSLDALIEFAIGAELREHAAASVNRAPKIAAVRTAVSQKSRPPRRAHQVDGGVSKKRDIPPKLRRLWAACKKGGWKYEGRPHTVDTFFKCLEDKKCLQCQQSGPACSHRFGQKGGSNE